MSENKETNDCVAELEDATHGNTDDNGVVKEMNVDYSDSQATEEKSEEVIMEEKKDTPKKETTAVKAALIGIMVGLFSGVAFSAAMNATDFI